MLGPYPHLVVNGYFPNMSIKSVSSDSSDIAVYLIAFLFVALRT